MALSPAHLPANTALGATLGAGGATFKVWAPSATAVYLNGVFGGVPDWSKAASGRALGQKTLRVSRREATDPSSGKRLDDRGLDISGARQSLTTLREGPHSRRGDVEPLARLARAAAQARDDRVGRVAFVVVVPLEVDPVRRVRGERSGEAGLVEAARRLEVEEGSGIGELTGRGPGVRIEKEITRHAPGVRVQTQHDVRRCSHRGVRPDGEIERDERPGRVGRDGTDRVDGGVARVERGRAGHRNGAADVARAYLARARGPGARRRERGAHVAAPAAVAVVVLDVDAGGPARGERGLADARPRLARLVRAAGRRARGVEAALRVLRARVERGALADVRRARAVRVRVARAGAGAGAALVRARARRSGVPRRAPVALHTARLDAQAAASRRRVRARVRAALRAPCAPEARAVLARRRRRGVEAPLRVLTAPVERRATGARGARRLARGIHVAHARGRPRAAASRAGLVRSARLRRAPRACRRSEEHTS